MLTVKFTDILLLVQSNAVRLSGILFLMKLGIYGLGIYIAIKRPQIVHIVSLIVGYLVTKITIYITMSKDTGGA